ncbi:MAG: hypothetical protein M1510_12245 [Nitrospirae bacterium]|nr:hypothetical protein [Nitrospirota bacterium]MCL5236773.1 hypothetical protein [Nitrospirota bacterium]
MNAHRKGILALSLALLLGAVFQTAIARAHWDMEPRFWADASKEKFFLRIHNGAHANRNPVRKELNVCFWIERSAGEVQTRVSEKKCIMTVLKPDEWMTFTFGLKDLAIHGDAQNRGTLKKGSYRAVAMAREQRSTLARIFLGAALERLYTYFEVK